MQISLPWINLFQFCLINNFFSLPLPTAHIYVTILFQTEVRLIMEL